MQYSSIFGPVVSGRLGRSLGLDLLGAKVCSFDCLYCEVGAGKGTFVRRKSYMSTRRVLEELRTWQQEDYVPLDHITLGGSGEPCLNTDMGDIIRGVRTIFPDVRVAVLTNSSLLHLPEVRKDLTLADEVMPSLDTAIPSEFQLLNRPHESLDLSTIMDGLMAFRQEFDGELALEVLLCRDINDSPGNLAALEEYVNRLGPDRVDVTTLSRPGAYDSAKAVEKGVVERWSERLNTACGCQVTRRATGMSRCTGTHSLSGEELKKRLKGSLKRRPQTAEDLAVALDVDPAAVRIALDELAACDTVVIEFLDSEDTSRAFYRLR